MKTQERIAKAWYLKQYLSQLDKLLIEEQCHTANDSKAFRQLLDLIERDTPKKPIDAVAAYSSGMPVVVAGKCPNCCANRTRQDSFCNCGQRLDWSE